MHSFLIHYILQPLWLFLIKHAEIALCLNSCELQFYFSWGHSTLAKIWVRPSPVFRPGHWHRLVNRQISVNKVLFWALSDWPPQAGLHIPALSSYVCVLWAILRNESDDTWACLNSESFNCRFYLKAKSNLYLLTHYK